jgi:glycosyltransferase involved in cell wall biosynthesis
MDSPISVLELRSVRGTGGGPEKTILLGTQLRNRSRFAVTICYIRDVRDEIFGIDERAKLLGVDYLEVRERHSFDFGILRSLKGLVRDKQIDIVHAHDYKSMLLALLLRSSARVIPLLTEHGWTGNSARERYVYYPVAKRMARRFPRVIAVSSEIKDELVHRGTPAERVTVLLNGIDPVTFRRIDGVREAGRDSLGYSKDAIVIGAVGRLERQKRFDLLLDDLLLDAFAPLSRRHQHLQLAIVGDGSLRTALASQAERLGIADRTRFLGHRDDIVQLHHAFDLFVQSSEYEGTPNAVLEAMAMETPVIATDVGGTKELAHPGIHALIVPKLDVAALQAAIDRTVNDPASARDRATAARRRVESELSFEARTRRLEDIYEQLMHERAEEASRV